MPQAAWYAGPYDHAGRAYAALASLRERLPLLDAALEPGTARRSSWRDLTALERQRQDAEARKDRAAVHVAAQARITIPGYTAAPLRIPVLDTITDTAASIAELEDAVCERLGITPLTGASTAQRITRIVGLLNRIAEQDDLAEHAAGEAARLNNAAGQALGDTEPVNRIDARCPICDALSLRAFPERELVVCINPGCTCTDQDCPCDDGDRPRRHRWLFNGTGTASWTWLAQLIDQNLEEAS